MTWHLVAAAALATGAISAVGDVPPAEAPLAQTTPEIEVIDLQTERYRRVTVPVTIGNQGPFRFMIDTGAQATVLSLDLADRLQLFDRESAILLGMASRRPVETTNIQDFGLGSRRFHIQAAALVEGEHIGGADGIIGLDSLQGQRVLFDFQKMEIAVADAAALGGNRGFEIIVRARARLGQLIITNAEIDGIPVSVVVDTGAQGSLGNPALLARLNRSRDLGDNELTDINGQTLGGAVKLVKNLQIGRGNISNFPIMFADSPLFHSLDLSEKPAIMLGMSELKLFRRVAIDFESRRVLFDLPPGAGWRSRFGPLQL
jgi:predicted aspartyl protease